MAFWNRWSPWYSQADVAREIGSNRSSVRAKIKSGALPEPMELKDPRDGRVEKGWPAPVIDEFISKRAGRQVSPAVATLPQRISQTMPVIDRRLVSHRYSVDHSADRSVQSLVRVYDPGEGKLIVIEPVHAGQETPGNPGVMKPAGRPRDLDYEPWIIAAIADVAEALEVDVFEVRWVIVSPGDGYEEAASGVFYEVIVKAYDPQLKPQYAVDWPFEVAVHHLDVADFAVRLGQPPEMLPAVCRTDKTVAALEKNDWDQGTSVLVDLDDAARTAYYASVLATRGHRKQADLLVEDLEVHDAEEELSAEDMYSDMYLPEGVTPSVTVAYPVTPQVTTHRPEREWTPKALQRLGQENRELIDLRYGKWGTEPDAIITKALTASQEAVSYRLLKLTRSYDRVIPTSTYHARYAEQSRVPVSPQTRYKTPDPHSLGFEARRRAIMGKAADCRLSLSSGQIKAWGKEAIGFAWDSNQTKFVFCTVSSLWAANREDYRGWQALLVHHDAQDAPIGVELEDGSILPMPLDDNVGFTTGYNGTGPGQAADAMSAFLEWLSERKLTKAERLTIQERTVRDKSQWVRIERQLFVDL